MFGCTFYFLTFKSLVEIIVVIKVTNTINFFEILPQQVIDN